MTRILASSDYQTTSVHYNYTLTKPMWPDEPEPDDIQPDLDAEIMLLLGDIFTVRHFLVSEEESDYTNLIPRRFMAHLIHRIAPQVGHIVLVPGNHEYYGTSLSTGLLILQDALEKYGATNITILNDDFMVLGDTVVYGTTLWSALPTIGIRNAAEDVLNDYHCINACPPRTGKLWPETTYALHMQSRAKLEGFLARFKTDTALMDKKLVIATHHAPSYQSLNPFYKNEVPEAYATPLDDLILANPHIRLWAHGHTHHPVDYTIGNTRIYSNPFGGEDDQCWRTFKPTQALEL